MHITIRKFRLEDLDTILKIFRDAVHTTGAKYYDAIQINAWAPREMDREKWLKSLSDHITYVAEEKGKVIGFGDMTKDGYIDRLFVSPKHQGRAIALKIFRKLEQEAKKLGLKELIAELSVMAKPLAMRQGFQVIKKQNKMVRGVMLENYVMRKSLL